MYSGQHGPKPTSVDRCLCRHGLGATLGSTLSIADSARHRPSPNLVDMDSTQHESDRLGSRRVQAESSRHGPEPEPTTLDMGPTNSTQSSRIWLIWTRLNTVSGWIGSTWTFGMANSIWLNLAPSSIDSTWARIERQYGLELTQLDLGSI